MRCDKAQELLMSDYLDNELGQKTASEVREHLLTCRACRSLADELNAQRELITAVKKEAVPDRVWQNIRREITAEKASKTAYAPSILERVKEAFLAPRPVLALASALAVIMCVVIMAGAIIRTQFFYAANGDSEDIFSVYMLNGQSADSLNDLGTSIEEYFL